MTNEANAIRETVSALILTWPDADGTILDVGLLREDGEQLIHLQVIFPASWGPLRAFDVIQHSEEVGDAVKKLVGEARVVDEDFDRCRGRGDVFEMLVAC